MTAVRKVMPSAVDMVSHASLDHCDGGFRFQQMKSEDACRWAEQD